MSSYPPGGDYDERLLDNAPKATKAELQEGYNVNLLASDTSETPINQRPQATVDDHASLEAGTNKEVYTSYAVPWYRQGKWRAIMLIGGIIIVGAIIGGVVGGVVPKHNNNTSVKNDNSTGGNTGANAEGTTITTPQSSPTNGPVQATQGNGPSIIVSISTTTTPTPEVPTSSPGGLVHSSMLQPDANASPKAAVDVGLGPAFPAALVG